MLALNWMIARTKSEINKKYEKSWTFWIRKAWLNIQQSCDAITAWSDLNIYLPSKVIACKSAKID